MGRYIEFECQVKPDDRPKRQSLANMVDIGMIVAEFRVTDGTYRVTIERIPQKKEPAGEHGPK